MAALPCPAFIPMYMGGKYICARCGFTLDYLQADDQGILVVINNNQLEHQQLPYTPPPAGPELYPELDLPMEIMLHPPLALPDHHFQLMGNINNTNNYNNNNGDIGVPAIRSWVFSEYQIVCMFAMAGRYQWSLRGHSRNGELHQFCVDIGISWNQFSNWVHRNRTRFRPGNNQLG